MIITGFVNKNNLPRIHNDNGVETYLFPRVYTKKEQLGHVCKDEDIIEIQIELTPRKVHV